MKVRLIVNTAAVGRARRAHIERLLRDRLTDLQITATAAPRDVLRLAAEAVRDGIDRVIVAGGDGSVHEAATAIAGSGVELAVVPGGSGNDFVRTLGIPPDPAAAVNIAASGRARIIDTIDVTCVGADGQLFRRVCVNIAEVGLGGRVVRLGQRLRVFVGRKAGYHAGLAVALLKHRWYPIRLAIDGTALGSYATTNLIVANGQYFGAGMRPMPGARLDDGVLDVALIADLSRRAIVASSGSLKTGLRADHPQIHQWRGREISAESDESVPVEADGELLGYLPATFRVRPASLKIVAAMPTSNRAAASTGGSPAARRPSDA
jgi:YegS/Rv2252/BmrU family lipid kinase